MKIARKVKDLFGLDVKDTAVLEIEDAPPACTPKLIKQYHFNKDMVKKLMLWIDGIGGHSLILTGPTGCGKSSLFEQFCSRLGIGLYRVPCHGRLEFQEVIGSFKLMEEAREVEANFAGKTPSALLGKWDALVDAIRRLAGTGPRMIWVDGPVVRAMREGCVVLLDEFNMLHATVFGGLNTILDGATFMIPETGEIVEARPGFRVAMTGNGVDGGADAVLYRGINKVNIAGLDRPCGIRVKYNDWKEDSAIILAAHPQMNPSIVEIIVKLAEKVRGMFEKGEMETVISTRKLVQWADLINARPWASDSPDDILQLLKKTLDFALLDVRPPAEQSAIHVMLDAFLRAVPPAAKKKPTA